MTKPRLYCCLTLLLPAICQGGTTEVWQTPGPDRAPSETPSKMPSGPDESILWSLFHAGKIEALKRQIADLKSRFPAWQVPDDLQKALHPTPKKAFARPQTQPKKPSAYRQASDGCARIDKQWARADTQLAKGHTRASADRYAAIITRCRNPELIKTTLEKAALLPDRDEYFHLIALAPPHLPDAELQELGYRWLKKAYLQKRHGAEAQAEPAAELLLAVERFQDTEFATVIAWHYFDRQAYQDAFIWFDKSEQWQTDDSLALFGKMLSLEKLGEVDAALAQYPEDSKDANVHEMAARLYKIKAWQHLKISNPKEAEQNLAKARAIVGGTDPEIRQIEAWLADSLHEYAKAAALFDDLYRQSPNTEYARAYVRNENRVSRRALAHKAKQTGGPLQDAYQQLVGADLYQRKQFLAAHDLTPAQFPNLANIDKPSADLGIYARHKSGEPGLDRLDILKMPTGGGEFTVDGIHHFRMSLSRMALNVGKPTKCSSPLGSLTSNTVEDCSNNFKGSFNPTHELTDALETEFSYRMDGWFSPYVKLGHTPTGAVIDPTITFDTGFVQQTQTGGWSLNVYSQPVRQSILSYTGMRDPYGHTLSSGGWQEQQREWGRVLRSGVKAAGYHRFNNRWGIYAAAEVAMLNGKNVADNTAFAASVNPSFNIPLAGFDYFSVGPALAYEHYEKNLSHFTLGHGGYFSPDHYVNFGPSLQFLSEEGRPLVVKGHVSAGIQLIEQSDAPWLPVLAPTAGTYQDDKGFKVSDALDIELKGVWLMAPNLQLGAGAAVRHASNYEDFTGGLFLRVFFDDRKASYSSDIPDSMFGNIQFY